MPFGCSYCLIGVSLISWCPSGLSGEKIEKRNMRWIPWNSVFVGKLIFTQPIDKRTRLPFNQGNQNKVFCIFPVFSSPWYEAFRSPPSDVEMFPPNGPHLRRCRPVLVVVPVCFFCCGIREPDLKAVRYEWPWLPSSRYTRRWCQSMMLKLEQKIWY